jgi:hypothetical protein
LNKAGQVLPVAHSPDSSGYPAEGYVGRVCGGVIADGRKQMPGIVQKWMLLINLY